MKIKFEFWILLRSYCSYPRLNPVKQISQWHIEPGFRWSILLSKFKESYETIFAHPDLFQIENNQVSELFHTPILQETHFSLQGSWKIGFGQNTAPPSCLPILELPFIRWIVRIPDDSKLAFRGRPCLAPDQGSADGACLIWRSLSSWLAGRYKHLSAYIQLDKG